jgi:hypothetical protein
MTVLNLLPQSRRLLSEPYGRRKKGLGCLPWEQSGMRLGVLGLFETLNSAVYLFPQNLIDNTKFLTPLDTPLTL